jgi:hypothetical protein
VSLDVLHAEQQRQRQPGDDGAARRAQRGARTGANGIRRSPVTMDQLRKLGGKFG